jgi:hypothetical protein
MLAAPAQREFPSLIFGLLTCTAVAQNSNCGEIHALAQMARSRAISALLPHQPAGSDKYRTHLVFAVRLFELSPKDRGAADGLLNLIPTNDDQQLVANSFGGFLCKAESDSDLRTLSALGDRLGRDFSKAILLAPDKMDSYVVYAAEAVQDTHSDYAIQMVPVCRTRHRAFVKAVENLGAGTPEKGHFATASTDWFEKHIFDPDNCRALAIPEAD